MDVRSTGTTRRALRAAAIAFALFRPRGLWRLADDRLPFRLFPAG